MSQYTGRDATGQAVTVAVSGSTISAITPVPTTHDDLPEILPVLVDLQHNGSLGQSYNELRTADQLKPIARHLRRHGVGRCLATLTTHPYDALFEAASAFAAICAEDPAMARLYPGIFHEGVFISPEAGWRGAHAPAWIKPPDFAAFSELDRRSGGRVRMINIAPEVPGALDFISHAVAAGKIVSIGHANPDTATVHEAVHRGARAVTHFGNGAPATIHRHHNPLWPMLAEPSLTLGLIGDGFHLPPSLVAAALRCKGHHGCFMVSDAAGFGGLPPGDYQRPGGMAVSISPAGRIGLVGSEILAGAWFQQDRCVAFLVAELGLPLRDAWALASTIPAAFAGLTVPPLEVGAEASFVLARWDGDLRLDQCVHAGEAWLDHPIHPKDCD